MLTINKIFCSFQSQDRAFSTVLWGQVLILRPNNRGLGSLPIRFRAYCLDVYRIMSAADLKIALFSGQELYDRSSGKKMNIKMPQCSSAALKSGSLRARRVFPVLAGWLMLALMATLGAWAQNTVGSVAVGIFPNG